MEVQELRAAERLSATEPLDATFAGYEATIVNVSTIGAQIEHATPIRLGTSGRFAARRGPIIIDVRGIVVWSRLSRTPDGASKHLYKSGLRIESGNREYALALHMLFKEGLIKREPDTLERKKERLLERLSGKGRIGARAAAAPSGSTAEISPDQMLLVQHARTRLLADPEDAQSWYQRARYAITHGASTVDTESLAEREQILAVWEYLERSIDIPVIARAFEVIRTSA